MQQIAWQVSLVLMILVAIGFMFVSIYSGRRTDDYPLMQERAYRIRARFFWVLVLMLGPAMVYNLMDLPYSASHARTSADGAQVQVVEARGYQWRWELSSDRFVVGQPVEFRVTSADINHGFAIYDTDMRLVAQTQAMPGYTNKLRYTFSKKGTYKILCLEYCGVAHHDMMTKIEVVEKRKTPT